MAFDRLAVILHLIEGGWVAVTVDDFLALFTTRTGDDHFIGIDFNGALSHDDITGEGDHVALHIKRLLVRFDVDRLVSVSGYGKCRNAGGQK